MPITAIALEPHTLPNRQGGFHTSLGRIDSALLSVVRLSTDDGAHGYGPAAIGTVLISGETHASVESILRVLAPRLLGRDPADLEAIMLDVEAAVPGNDRLKAAVDIALHDLIARRLGVPVYGLLGGRVRDRVPILRLVGMAEPAAMAERAVALVAEGFRYLKLKVGSGPAADVDRVAAVRAAVGPDVHLMIDLNQAYRPKEAVLALRALRDHGVEMVEQPVHQDDIAGLAFVRRHADVPVEADESIRSLATGLAVIRAEAVDYVSIKIGKVGGIRNARKLAALCEAANVGTVVGFNGGGQLFEAANMQFIASAGEISYACEVGEFHRVQNDPASGLESRDGDLLVPDGPGLGVHVRFEGVEVKG